MHPARDSEGYLLDWQSWDESIASWIAQQEGLILTSAHLAVIQLLRSFYQEFHTVPAMRVLAKLVNAQLGDDKDSVYLHTLFPGGPLKQASKIAGLPKPKKCLS